MRLMTLMLVAGGLAAMSSAPSADQAGPPDYPITAVPLTAVTLTDGFWAPKMAVNRTMSIPRVLAHDGVAEDRGKAAIQRGPLVYCLEAVDNGGTTSGVTLPLDAPLAHEFKRDLLGGIEVITGPSMMAIPYHAWADRGRGEMSVWILTAKPATHRSGAERPRAGVGPREH
jgi:hypothetical protein